MTKTKFWFLKTSLLCISSYLLYISFRTLFFGDELFDKIDFFIRGQNAFLQILLFSIVFLISISIFILLSLFFLFSITLEREKTLVEIEELEKKQREVRKQVEEWEQSLQQEPPLMEITLSNNEKIIRQFEEIKEYFENIKTESRYYKSFIVKIEKVEKQ
jgi:hypothetical protein